MTVAQPKIKGLEEALFTVEQKIYELAHRRAMARVTSVVAEARAGWPLSQLRRKHSKYLWRIVDHSDGRERVHIVIHNDARDKRGTPYAFYIRSDQVPGAGYDQLNAWLVLIRRPMLKAMKELAEQTATDPVGRE